MGEQLLLLWHILSGSLFGLGIGLEFRGIQMPVNSQSRGRANNGSFSKSTRVELFHRHQLIRVFSFWDSNWRNTALHLVSEEYQPRPLSPRQAVKLARVRSTLGMLNRVRTKCKSGSGLLSFINTVNGLQVYCGSSIRSRGDPRLCQLGPIRGD